jgi:hypothetical protein
MGETAYVEALEQAQRNWMRTRIMTDRGDVIDFTVQYETLDRGRRVAVIRYDSAHGFPHIDVLNRRGNVIEKTPLPTSMSMKEALQFGISDIKQNWRTYRLRFFGDES